MKVFVTSGSGWVGSHVVPVLISRGHAVTALARSPESASKVTSLGATPILGDLSSLDVLRKAASEVDAVIHLAFIHDFQSPDHDWEANKKVDMEAITAMGEGFASSSSGDSTHKIFINTSGTLGQSPGKVLTEEQTQSNGRRPDMIQPLRQKGIKAFAVRLSPTVHGTGDKGFVPIYVSYTKKNGFAAYIGDGAARWSAVHVTDAATLYCDIIDKADKLQGTHYHAVGEGEIVSRELAEVTAKRLGVPIKSITPQEAGSVLGFVGMFLSLDSPCSNEITRREIGWNPVGPTLFEDVADSPSYSGVHGA